MPGGGAALLHLSELVPAFKETLVDPEERLGADIVMKSLRAPCRLIADNAGVEGEVSCGAAWGDRERCAGKVPCGVLCGLCGVGPALLPHCRHRRRGGRVVSSRGSLGACE